MSEEKIIEEVVEKSELTELSMRYIRGAVAERQITQADFSNACGFTTQRFLTGGISPRLSQIEKMLDVLEINKLKFLSVLTLNYLGDIKDEKIKTVINIVFGFVDMSARDASARVMAEFLQARMHGTDIIEPKATDSTEEEPTDEELRILEKGQEENIEDVLGDICVDEEVINTDDEVEAAFEEAENRIDSNIEDEENQ